MRKLGKMFSQIKMSLMLLESGPRIYSKANSHTPSAAFFYYSSRSGIWSELRHEFITSPGSYMIRAHVHSAPGGNLKSPHPCRAVLGPKHTGERWHRKAGAKKGEDLLALAALITNNDFFKS